MAFVASVASVGGSWGLVELGAHEVVATLLLSVSNLTGTGHLTLYSVWEGLNLGPDSVLRTYTMSLHPSDYAAGSERRDRLSREPTEAMFALLGAAGGLVRPRVRCQSFGPGGSAVQHAEYPVVRL